MMLQERILRNFEFPHFVIHSAKGSKTFWHYELQNGETQIFLDIYKTFTKQYSFLSRHCL